MEDAFANLATPDQIDWIKRGVKDIEWTRKCIKDIGEKGIKPHCHSMLDNLERLVSDLEIDINKLSSLLSKYAFDEVRHPEIGPMAQCRSCKEVDRHAEDCELGFLSPWSNERLPAT